MPSPSRLVINTSPLLACVAGCGSLAPLEGLYEELLVPKEVAEEIEVGGPHGFGVAEIAAAVWLHRCIWLSDAVVAFALRECGEF